MNTSPDPQPKTVLLVGASRGLGQAIAGEFVKKGWHVVLYSEAALERGLTTEKADLLNASMPYGLMPQFNRKVTAAVRADDAEMLGRLEKAGFLLDFGDDDSGLYLKYMRRGSGYYIDVGASELIASGQAKLKSGIGVREVTERGILLDDGTELPADLIVYATGYGSMTDGRRS